ncbi:hypothetical protein PZ938_19585 [Luteipulveratus sp. YIM 133132]|uniref:ABC transporter permease n=1 Tax=Luteipulveratus flavus TaxID=3031728 RepID=A0ABT6C6P8_9MICO|nr:MULTISPECIES: hypothetical protein [unclassified Luteipulveratus]MDE9367826.1 hypothetical protein [Luteipulveratus sp. YIM 133132]MDF8263754.1 hypothetical protein [Luteipulveratus sp. YIM 133296]
MTTATRPAETTGTDRRLRGGAFLAEWTRLGQRRVWLPAIATTVLYAAVVTFALIATAQDRGPGVTISALSQSGGGTLAPSSAARFASVLLLAVFVGLSAGAFSKGTWRAALLHHPGRFGLAVGTFLARIAGLAVIVALLFVVGWATAAVVGPSQGVDTSAWTDAASWQSAAEDFLRVLGFGVGWALLGTAVGMATRSVPVGLAVAVLWAGPIENVLGDSFAFGQRWFPGLLLRYVVAPDSLGISLSNAELYGTLAAYGVVLLGVIAFLVGRRDVTS